MNYSKSLVINDIQDVSIEELEIPEIGDYDVLYRTSYTSLCTIEQRAYSGVREFDYPFLGGHESTGKVIKTGKHVLEIKENDHVVLTSGYCNQCLYCRTNRGTQCQNKNKLPQRIKFPGKTVGGSLSEYLVVPAWQLIRLSDDVNLLEASLIEPLACSIHSIGKCAIGLGDTVTIVGFGVMGYIHMKLAQLQGAKTIVLERDKNRLEFAKTNGAICFDTTQTNWKEQLLSVTNVGSDVVINTIATEEIWHDIIDILAPYGRLIAYSSQDSNEGINIDFGLVHSKEYEYIGTVNPTIIDNQKAVNLLENKMIDLSAVIDSIYKFDEYDNAFQRAIKPNVYRVIIDYDS